MTKVFDDGMLEATLYGNGWVLVRWLQNMHGRLQKKLIKDLNFLERCILAMKYKGWFAMSELENTDFHKLLTRFGALPREIEGQYKVFVKPILKESDLHVR